MSIFIERNRHYLNRTKKNKVVGKFPILLEWKKKKKQQQNDNPVLCHCDLRIYWTCVMLDEQIYRQFAFYDSILDFIVVPTYFESIAKHLCTSNCGK